MFKHVITDIAVMERIAMWCVLLALTKFHFAAAETTDEPAIVAPVQDLNIRLSNVEKVLEAVLKKNSELELRIDTLEYENRQLKAEVKVLMQERGHGHEEEVGDAVRAQTGSQPTTGSRLEPKFGRRGAKSPRIVMSEEATVAFTATLEATRTGLGKGQTIVYDHVVTNVGGAYHSSSGIFIAPVSGVYVFNYVTHLEPGDSQYLVLVKDGVTAMNTFVHGSGESHYMSSAALVTLQMRQGEEVWVQTFAADWHGSGTIHGSGFSSFSGWLLAYTD